MATWRLVLAGDEPEEVATARGFVARLLAGLGRNDVTADLVLATSELVTNAFQHGSSSDVTVRVGIEGHTASVTVDNETVNGAPGDEDWTMAGPLEPDGRGLAIVRAVADRIDVRRDGDRLSINVERDY